jgi:hypothetical protein
MGGWAAPRDDTRTYTVEVTPEQAERWEAAATERCMAVSSWLVDTADAHVRELARSGRATPLLWDRGRFLVRLTDTSRRPEIVADVEVPGHVSRPFGIFRGTARGTGAPGSGEHSLAHLPTRRIIATLSLRKSCMALAAELAVLRVDWQETDPEKVLGNAPDREAVQGLIRLFKTLTRT